MSVRYATAADVPTILRFIQELAEYEKLPDEAKATEEDLQRTLFGPRPYAEVLIAEQNETPVGFALFFHNYSTWLGKPGIYLEDLYVQPTARGGGHGKALLTQLARICELRNCGRLEWSVLDWNQPAIDFYENLGAGPMEGWTTFRLTGEALERLALENSN
jgi:GNAT superfamily N-acetyltransferase